VTTVLLVRHGLTATTGHVLTGWTPGIPLDDRGRAQAAALAARLAPLPLDAIVSSPLERCQQTAAAVAASRDGQQVITDERVGECHYGDWTGQPLKKLVREQLWRVVQAHPSAVTFPGPDGESMPDMQHRAVAAVREWNARLGKDATYLICSHGDVIKAIVADSLGLHLDQCQRIQADPCSLTVIRYTPLRPFLVRMNDRGGGVDDLMPRADGHARGRDPAQSDAAIGGGAGGAAPETPENLADRVNGATSIPAGAAAVSGQQSADTRG
jgi:probable phosphomutase (TIGR03848 family)